jgi:ribosomal protein L7/L12
MASIEGDSFGIRLSAATFARISGARGNKIEAIKRYRETTAVDLKEAKDFIEEVQRRSGGV